MNKESRVWQTLRRFGILSGASAALAAAVLVSSVAAKAPSQFHPVYDPPVGRCHPSFPPKPGQLPYDFMWGTG